MFINPESNGRHLSMKDLDRLVGGPSLIKVTGSWKGDRLEANGRRGRI